MGRGEGISKCGQGLEIRAGGDGGKGRRLLEYVRISLSCKISLKHQTSFFCLLQVELTAKYSKNNIKSHFVYFASPWTHEMESGTIFPQKVFIVL